MKHYYIKYGVCTIDISTFTYRNAFNWSIYARVLDYIYEMLKDKSCLKITFTNFDKLFKITKARMLYKQSTKNYDACIKRNLAEKIIDYTYNTLVLNSIQDTKEIGVVNYISDLKNISIITNDLLSKSGMSHINLFIDVDNEFVNEILHEIVDDRLIS